MEAQVSATWIEDNNGTPKRQFRKLNLERNTVFLFPTNWTIVHPISQKSPFQGKSKEELRKRQLEVIILIKGFDESYNQVIHANSSYVCEEMTWGQRFAPMVSSDDLGTIVHLDKIDETIFDEEYASL